MDFNVVGEGGKPTENPLVYRPKVIVAVGSISLRNFAGEEANLSGNSGGIGRQRHLPQFPYCVRGFGVSCAKSEMTRGLISKQCLSRAFRPVFFHVPGTISFHFLGQRSGRRGGSHEGHVETVRWDRRKAGVCVLKYRTGMDLELGN